MLLCRATPPPRWWEKGSEEKRKRRVSLKCWQAWDDMLRRLSESYACDQEGWGFGSLCSTVRNLSVCVGAASAGTVRGARGQNHRGHHRRASGPPTRLGENSFASSDCRGRRWRRLPPVGLTLASHSWWQQKKNNLIRSHHTCWYIRSSVPKRVCVFVCVYTAKAR